MTVDRNYGSATGPSKHVPHVVVWDDDGTTRSNLAATFHDRGYETEGCGSQEDLIEVVLRGTPDVVVYVLRSDPQSDLAVLQLLRRVKPTVPLILVSPDASVRVRRSVLDLRPTYFAISPVDGAEMCDAVDAAIHRRRAAS